MAVVRPPCPARRAAAVSADGRFALSLDGSSWLLWDVAANRPGRVGTVGGLPPAPWALAVADDGTTLIVGGADGSLAAFDLPTGHRVWSAVAHVGRVAAVALPGPSLVVSVGADGTVRCQAIPGRGWGRPVGRWGLVVRGMAALAVAAGAVAGWVPTWVVGLIPVLFGFRTRRRLRVAVSLSERAATWNRGN